MSEQAVQITDGQREIVRQALVDLNKGLPPQHWGDTDFGRIIGATIWSAIVGVVIVGIIHAIRM